MGEERDGDVRECIEEVGDIGHTMGLSALPEHSAWELKRLMGCWLFCKY